MKIIFEGSVGSGKTTLATKISQKLNIKLYEELINPNTYKLLEDFYADQKRWSFALQIHFLNERFKMVKDLQNKNNGILDRSIFGDRIFAELLYEDNKMTIEEYTTYKTLLDNMLEHVSNPDILVYIDCDLDTLVERINIRNREMELNVPKNYWDRLNTKYKNWYEKYDKCKKIKIDGKSYHPDNEEDIDDICNKIIKKLRYDM